MISLRDVVTGFGVRDPLAEVWRRSLRGGGGGAAEITGVPPLRYIGDGRPLTDYRIAGNTVQDGTPSAEVPADVAGCGVRTGNLFSSAWELGSINGTTGQNEPSTSRVRTTDYIEVSPNKIYSFSRSVYRQFMNVRFYSADKSFAGVGSASTIRLIVGHNEGNPMYAGDAFCCFEIINPNIKYMRIGDQSNDLSTKYMMVEGQYTEQTMPEYEPYGYKLPITCAGQTVPVYLGQTPTVRKIKKWVLTGEETFSAPYGNSIFYAASSGIGIADHIAYEILCTHFARSETNFAMQMADKKILLSSASLYIRMDAATTVSDFKSYLAAQYAAGTPVTVWYVLAEPETAIVNEPLMKIGDYADTVSFAQAGVTIPTVNGENVLDVPTEVPPSEVTIKGGISSV